MKIGSKNFRRDEGQRQLPNAAARWTAVVGRDARADGQFVYGVKSTGVYCRPSCPSRQPLRKNVEFHNSCAEAEAAGFRACRRCQPNGPAPAENLTRRMVEACRRIEAADPAGPPPTLAALAQTAAMSKYHFHRSFTRVTGLTPKAYAAAHRAERMRGELSRSPTVTEAIYAAGFNSGGRFYADSARILGMKPKRFQRGGAGEVLRFAIGESDLGPILVASSERGVCAILLGNEPSALIDDLQGRFPRAQLVGGDRAYERLVARVVGLVQQPRAAFALPLDLRGTVFQRRVWRALNRIPPGTTLTYAELARRIGAPKAVRAVAAACAANALAVAIPCHRVIRSDGGLAGYRWGVERKRALLKRESISEGRAPS